MSKTAEQIMQEREDMVLSKLSHEEKLVYHLSHLAELIADGDIDGKEWLDDLTDAIDFILGHIKSEKE
jgi:hypothetical protein